MCNCIKDIENKVVEMKKKDNPGALILKASMKNYGFSFGKNPGVCTYNEVQYTITPKKKDGSMGRQVNKVISIYHTYCPFCGKKTSIEID